MLRFSKFVFRKKSFLLNLAFTKNFISVPPACQQYKTIKDVRLELEKALGSGDIYAMSPKSKKHLMKYMVKSQKELPLRKMKESFDAAIVPLSTNTKLRMKYTTHLGHLRIGRLLEDVDIFAVWCCTKHLLIPGKPENEPHPYIIVTIRMDNMELFNCLRQPTSDVRLSGHVCWVGQSSLEVIVWLDQEINGKWEGIKKAMLLMAARNPTNTGPAVVNAIEPETPQEKELFEGGEKRKLERLQILKRSLLKEVPSEQELHLVHDLFKETIDSSEVFLDKRVLPPGAKWMKDATLSTLLFCHPEYRNLHNKIFGGFLIRQALELSWIVAYIFGMRVPKLVHISDIGFYSPVDVGSLLKLYSSVNYSEKQCIQVSVYAEAVSHYDTQGKTTNSFNFTYDLGKSDSLYPLTYLEAMKYIDGRRHFKDFEGKKKKS